MNAKKLAVAKAEAKRFLATVKALEERCTLDDIYEFTGCRESGACRRASLDLTRALAELRRPS